MDGKLTILTNDTLLSLNDDELEYELFLFILERVIKDDFSQEYEIIAMLPVGLKYFYVSWNLEAEVNNGGFNQYFYNTSGQFIDEAIESFKYFNLPEISKIVIKAAEIAIEEIDLHIETRKKATIEAFSESYKYTNLGQADDEFYQLSDKISPSRISKIRSNIEDFILIK